VLASMVAAATAAAAAVSRPARLLAELVRLMGF
jgi:hypothetical protein